MGEAFVKPGLAGLDPGVGEGVSERGAGRGGCERGDGSDEQWAVFKGLAGVVEDGEGGERVFAQPKLEERRDALGGGGEAGEDAGVGGGDGEHGSAAGGGCAVGVGGGSGGGAGGGLREWRDEGFRESDDEEIGLADAEGLGGEVGCCDAGAGSDGSGRVVGVRDEGLAAAAEVDGDGGLAFVLDGNAEVDACGPLCEARDGDGLEELCAVAEEERRCGDGVPEDVAEAAEGGGESAGGGVVGTAVGGTCADGVPIGVEGFGGRCADALEARGVRGDGAGVEGVEREGGARGEGGWEIQDRFGGFAGVVDVGIDDVLRDRKLRCAVWSDEGGALPDEGRGDLQGDAVEGLAADVAHGDAGAHGEARGVGREAGFKIVGGEEESCADGGCDVGVGGGEGWGGSVFSGGGWCAVTLEEDFAVGGGSWCWRGGLGVRGDAREEECEGEDSIQGRSVERGWQEAGSLREERQNVKSNDPGLKPLLFGAYSGA